MIAGEKNPRDAHTLEILGPCILRMLKDRLAKRIGNGRTLVAQDSREQPGDGFHHDHGGEFSAHQNIIADGYLIIGKILGNPLIDPFVPAANENEQFPD